MIAYNTSNWFQAPRIGGTNSRPWMPQWGIVASLGANVDIITAWKIQTAPTATLKLALYSIANATTGVAKVNPSWAAGAIGTNFDTVSLSAEGVNTITWAAGNNDDVLETKITLDATTLPTAGQLLFLQIRFETASWTLAQLSYWSHALLDE
jgi:hypothetical protein